MALKGSKNRTIVLPISEKNYDTFMNDKSYAREIITSFYKSHPELFPASMSSHYRLNGKTRISKKITGFRMRKILILGVNYQIRPSFILPYCKEQVSFVSKGLFLLRFGVPFWALAFVFGYNATWWYRLFISLSQHDIVGTTIGAAKDLPSDILADEHHIKVKGVKKYVATTVAADCFLGMAVCDEASEASLSLGYGVFKEECEQIDPNYAPQSVNTDGWAATQKAWEGLYDKIAVIACFLHAFLKVRNRATKKMQAFFHLAGDKIWDIYKADTKRQVSQKIRRLREWTNKQLANCPMKDHILKLCANKNKWLKHLDYPNAHRTSNMLDRLMRAMKKHKINSQMFHSTTQATTKNFRAFALIHNFSPSCPSVWKEDEKLKSPAARLNKKVMADNWLENLILSAKKHQFRKHSKT